MNPRLFIAETILDGPAPGTRTGVTYAVAASDEADARVTVAAQILRDTGWVVEGTSLTVREYTSGAYAFMGVASRAFPGSDAWVRDSHYREYHPRDCDHPDCQIPF
jgi:hypothetical protein